MACCTCHFQGDAHDARTAPLLHVETPLCCWLVPGCSIPDWFCLALPLRRPWPVQHGRPLLCPLRWFSLLSLVQLSGEMFTFAISSGDLQKTRTTFHYIYIIIYMQRIYIICNLYTWAPVSLFPRRPCSKMPHGCLHLWDAKIPFIKRPGICT